MRRVYDGLRGEGGYGTCACGVKYLEESLSRGKAKELAKFFVEASQAVDFESCLAKKMSTLRKYELWTNVERTDLPAYLKRTSAQNETLFGLPPASVPGLGRSNVAHAQRCMFLMWPRLRDDCAHYI